MKAKPPIPTSGASTKEFDEVREIIASVVGIDEQEITPTASFLDDLRADSLDLVEIIMALEEKYGIQFDDERAMDIKTVAQLLAEVRNSPKAKPKVANG